MPLALAPGVLDGTPADPCGLVQDDVELDCLTDGGDDGHGLRGGARVSVGSEEHQGVGRVLLAEGVRLAWGLEEGCRVGGLDG